MSLQTRSLAKAHGGIQGVYTHESVACGVSMTFAVFVPPHEAGAKMPVLWFLSGLTCTHANVMEKGEYRRAAAELGMIVVCPDTSPRGEGVAFQHKVMARMQSALAQSEGAWLPQVFPEAPLDRALLAAPPGDRVVLDPAGSPMIGESAGPLSESRRCSTGWSARS
jgi:hypothetical protein